MQSWVKFTLLVFAACVAILAFVNVVTAHSHRVQSLHGHMAGQYVAR